MHMVFTCFYTSLYTIIKIVVNIKGIRTVSNERPSKEQLYQMYVVEGLTPIQIARKFGYTASESIRYWLNKYSIPKRTVTPNNAVRSVATREQLYQWHVVEGLTAVKIASALGCNQTTISGLIKEYGLDPGRALVNRPIECPVTRDELWYMYIVEGMGFTSIGQLLGVGDQAVERWVRAFGFEVHSNGRYTPQVKRTLEDSTYTTYGFDDTTKLVILSRDSWVCQMPNCDCSEKWKLQVHHILPLYRGGTNDSENGITLCEDCHRAIRGVEDEWVEYFLSVVQEY